MLSDSLLTALGSVTGVILLVVAVYVYVALIRQIRARELVTVDGSTRDFGLPEAILASGLVLLLLLSLRASLSGRSVELNNLIVLETLLFTAAIALFITAFLAIRGFNIVSITGLSRISFLRSISTGTVLILAAYPLMIVSEMFSQSLLGGGSNKQDIVEFFVGSRSITQRMMVIVFAIAIAPVIEEFLFRFFLYRVFRRYLGVSYGMILNAGLFAAVHTHLPSFAPLFVLGLCLTVGYEWSGSILVSMTMHSLFNASQLTALAFPELFRQ